MKRKRTSTKYTHKIVCPTCTGRGAVNIADPAAMRRARLKRGLSVRGLAKRIKLSAPFLSDVELGKRPCTEAVLKAYQKL